MDEKSLSDQEINNLLQEVEGDEKEASSSPSDLASLDDIDLNSEQAESADILAEKPSDTESVPAPVQTEEEPPPEPGQVKVQNVSFPDMGTEGEAKKMDNAEESNMNLLMDVQMDLTVELGRTKMFIKEILGLGEGSIIELDKLAGEPVDLLVNGKLVAKGEVVVIDENFGVRVTDIVTPAERAQLQFEEKG